MRTQPKPLVDISGMASDMGRAERRLQRNGRARLHQVADFEQRCRICRRGMQQEIGCRKAAALEQRDRQGVAQRKLHQRGGGWRQISGQASRARQRQHNVRGLWPALSPRLAGIAIEADTEPSRVIGEVFQLRRFARPRQRQDGRRCWRSYRGRHGWPRPDVRTAPVFRSMKRLRLSCAATWPDLPMPVTTPPALRGTD